jgi:hypothetical protein
MYLSTAKRFGTSGTTNIFLEKIPPDGAPLISWQIQLVLFGTQIHPALDKYYTLQAPYFPNLGSPSDRTARGDHGVFSGSGEHLGCGLGFTYAPKFLSFHLQIKVSRKASSSRVQKQQQAFTGRG